MIKLVSFFTLVIYFAMAGNGHCSFLEGHLKRKKETRPSCRQYWQENSIQGQYDFQSDSLQSELGNVGYPEYYERLNRKECVKDWTVLIYMAADNDLSPYGLWDVYEIEHKIKNELNLGATTENIDVIAELDTYTRTGSRRLHLFQTENDYDDTLTVEDFKRRNELSIYSPIVQHFPEETKQLPSTQEARFRSFLQWARQNYPSKKTMVVVWGHGEGFIGKGYSQDNPREFLPKEKESLLLTRDMVYLDIEELTKPFKFPLNKVFGGVAFDHSDGTFLDIPTIKNIFNEQYEQTGRPIDVTAFDACLMQSVEVASELVGQTEFIVGSVQIQNYLGLPYRKILDLINKRSYSAYRLVQEIPRLAEESFLPGGYQGDIDPDGYKTFTVSSLNTHELYHQLLPSLMEFSRALVNYVQEFPLRGIDLGFVLEQGATFRGETRDLGVFMGTILKLLYQEREISAETREMFLLKKKAQKVLDAINRSMMSYRYGSSYIEQTQNEAQDYLLGFFKGLSIWIPNNSDLFGFRINEFEKSKLFQYSYNDSHWQNWMKRLFQAKGPDFPFPL